MSLFLRAGQACLTCFQNKDDHTTREGCRNDMFTATSQAIQDADTKFDYDELPLEQKQQVEVFSYEIRLACFNCDGNEAYVFEMVKGDVAEPMEKDLSDAKKEVAEERKRRFHDKGVEMRGNLFIIKKFIKT